LAIKIKLSFQSNVISTFELSISIKLETYRVWLHQSLLTERIGKLLLIWVINLV